MIAATLSELPWEDLLAKHPEWRWDRAKGELSCEEQRGVVLTSVRPTGYKAVHTGIILRRPLGGCEVCSSREGCLKSNREKASKHVELSVPTAIAAKLRERQLLIPGQGKECCRVGQLRTLPGERAVMESLFLPAKARQRYRNAFSGASLRIKVELPEVEPTVLRLVAADVGCRQHRRKTWAQNLERNALPDGARIEIEVEGSSALRAWLGERRTTTPQAGQAG